ncbi:ComEC/Rec2 family competence protein [Metaclostridioides mangenotii]|uniref:Competence protein ComEC n=1 Tax=Metaclostridioides mangenotii TaxID=1540 RepID=A0ABS4E6R9_9FIRM|nr:ComEC/Rec2 family competence protein [Clostridioides mangenotii]MBP1853631.1 competence protein ComEC [Clostridioides mangenotii]
MRRPMLIVFLVILFVDVLLTNFKDVDYSFDDQIVNIRGVVKDKIEKPKYNQYKVGSFLVNDYSRTFKLDIGQEVNVNGKFKSLDKMKFDDFDYGRYVKSTGYKGIIYIKSYEVVGEDFIYKYLGTFKLKVRDISRYLYKEYSNFVNSILLGDSSSLNEDEKLMFKRTGTSHVIAISGLHTGILCVIIAFMMRGVNKFYKLFILIILMYLYSIMVGSSPSVLRSIIFSFILYFSIFVDRKRDGISTLAFIGSLFIFNNPFVVYNVSFQLSFAATLSIIYFEPYFFRAIKLRLISVTISSNILTLPIIYYTFGGIPVLSIVGNIIVVPFMAVIMYLSIFSILLYKFILVSKVIAFINLSVIKNIYYMLDKIGNLSFSYLDIKSPKFYIVLVYYTVVFTYMVYWEIKEMREQDNGLQGYYKEY